MQFDLSTSRNLVTTDWISLNQTQRVNIHPLFRSIEEFNCSVHYQSKLKCFYVEYGYNENTKKYDKGILSNSITNIVDDVLAYYALVL